MTRARALKQIIRERAAKTGERYTTARRHVLKLTAIDGSAVLTMVVSSICTNTAVATSHSIGRKDC